MAKPILVVKFNNKINGDPQNIERMAKRITEGEYHVMVLPDPVQETLITAEVLNPKTSKGMTAAQLDKHVAELIKSVS